MPSERKKLPSVLMLLLSALGIFISLLVAAAALLGSNLEGSTPADSLTFTSLGALALFLSLLNLPTLIYSIRALKGKQAEAKHASLFRSATIALLVWVILLAAGTYLNKASPNSFFLAPLTILCVAIPIWWLVEFARRGLTRPSPTHEWNTLTLGLTLTPMIIIIIEILLVILVTGVVIILLGFQPGSLNQIMDFTANLDLSQGGMEQLDQLLYDLAQNPTVAGAIYLVIGLMAPFTEELFKPLAVWLAWRRPLDAREGFILGLISGGAFTLLESASLVSQITTQDWISAVVLRSATGLLHIGLSGLVGYGIAKARSEKRWRSMLLSLLAATGLHGLWNSMALLNGFSTTPLPMAETTSVSAGGAISLIVMLLVFAAVLFITIKLNARLKQEQLASQTILIDS